MNKKHNVIVKQTLAFMVAVGLAFGLVACGDDGSSSTGPKVECLDNENCLDDDTDSSNSEKDLSSSAKQSTPGSSAKEEPSSSDTKDGSSSSSAKTGDSSSSDKPASGSSTESGSSQQTESSASVKEYVYLSTTPNAADLEVSGDTLFAVFQRYTPVTSGAAFNDNGLLALYNLKTGALLDTIQLATKNPMSVKVVNGDVYVGTQGVYNASFGVDADENRGIEKIDLKKKKSELWVTGTALGGGVSSMEVNAKDGKVYVAVFQAFGTVPVVEVDIANKNVKSVGKVVDATGGLFYDTETNLLYIGDRGYIAGFDYGDMLVRVYNGTTLAAATDEDGPYQPYSIAKAGGEIFVYVSDYHSGALYWIEDDDFSSERVQFSSDAVIRNVGGKLIVLDRGGDAEKGNIAEVDPAAKSVSWQKAFETKVNPYDIVAINGSNAWVALYDVGEIRKISLADGSTVSSINTEKFSARKEKE